MSAVSRFCSDTACGNIASRWRASASHALQGPVCFGQQVLGGLPVDAGIGDGHAVFERAQVLRNGLLPRFQMTLEHEPDNRAVTVDYLSDAVFGHLGLQDTTLRDTVMATS